MVVTLTPPQVSTGVTPATVVDWKSGRSHRVCRSTLAAEASAADEGADRGAFANMWLSEVLYNMPAHRVGQRLPSKQVTDAKSLYDAVIAENPRLTDRRSLVNIRAIQESVKPEQMHWIPTTIMWADGLTKCDPKLRETLMRWLQQPFCQLTSCKAAKVKRI